jgi:glycosyltransferase involved in cell wall biosynthesis
VTADRRLLVLCGDADGPVARTRALAYRLPLARAGVVLEVATWPTGFLARRAVLARAAEFGNVWVLARLLNVADVRRLRARVKRLLFDFDDALPLHDSRRHASRSWTRRRRFRAVLRAADAVSAGNAHLADLAAEEGVAAVVLPTVVPCDDAPPAPEPAPPPHVIGWIGSRATLPYLRGATVPLAAVVATGMPFRLRVVADGVPVMPPGIPVEGVPWTAAGEGPAIDGMQVGIAPLPDDAWTRGKCGLKVLQMLSRGRPVVASAVGVQREQVRHGVTGFLAATPEDWLTHLTTLLTDPALRRRMGEAAKRDVRAHWSVPAWEDRVVAHVTKALA